MDLIRFQKRNDSGPEYIVKIINTNKHWPRPLREVSLIQLSVSWTEYKSMPYLHLTMGGNGFFSILFIIYKFGIDVDLLTYTWKIG